MLIASLLAVAAVLAAPDVLRYDVALDLDPAQGTLTGEETVQFQVGDAADSVSFDATDLEVEGATLDGRPVAVSAEKGRLTLTGFRSLPPHRKHTLRLRYRAKPQQGLRLSADAVWTAFNTWNWMVARTDPADRARARLQVTLPADLVLAGTGQRQRVITRKDGRRRHQVDLETPYPAYLLGFAAGRLETRERRADGVTLRLLAPPGLADRLAPTMAETARMMRFLTDKAGLRYPLGAYTEVYLKDAPPQEMAAGLTLLDADYGASLVEDPREDWLRAHELAHQWWGNLLTCRTWGEFWLNEGMATFLAAAWKEERWGREAYDRELRLAHERLDKARAEGRNRPLVRPGWNTPEGAGGTIPYQRGFLFLDALRRDLGEAAFWSGLRAYTRSGAGGSVTGADLRRALEHASGRDLAETFRLWEEEP